MTGIPTATATLYYSPFSDSAASSIRGPSASALAGIAGHFARHFHFSDQTEAGFKRRDAQTGAITLIQRFGSAANLNIHLHCLVLDGVYHIQDGVPACRRSTAYAHRHLHNRGGLLSQIIQRINENIDPPRRAH